MDHNITYESRSNSTRREREVKVEKPAKKVDKCDARPRNYVTIVRGARMWRNTRISGVMRPIKMYSPSIFKVFTSFVANTIDRRIIA